MVVVDDLDEGLDLVSLFLSGLGHAASDLGGVSLNTSDQGVTEGMGLVAVVDGLDDDNLQRAIRVSVQSSSEITMRKMPSFLSSSRAPVSIPTVQNMISSRARETRGKQHRKCVVPSFRRICRG